MRGDLIKSFKMINEIPNYVDTLIFLLRLKFY